MAKAKNQPKKSKKSKKKIEKSPPSIPFDGKSDSDKLAKTIWQAGLGALLVAEKGAMEPGFRDLATLGRKAELDLLRQLETKKGRADVKKLIKVGKASSKAAKPDRPAKVEAATPVDARGRLDVAIGTPDDLTDIRGVGPALQLRLHELGVFHLWQIAELSDAQILELESEIGARAGVTRNDWRAQAVGLTSSTT